MNWLVGIAILSHVLLASYAAPPPVPDERHFLRKISAQLRRPSDDISSDKFLRGLKRDCLRWTARLGLDRSATARLSDALRNDDYRTVKRLMASAVASQPELDGTESSVVDICTSLAMDDDGLPAQRSGRGRRETAQGVSGLVDKHLSWLSEQQRAEIIRMTESGASHDAIKERLFQFISQAKPEEKEAARQKCYAWLEKAASKAEIDDLHAIHHTNHSECKRRVRVYITRLPAAEQKEVLAKLPFCEQVWYGDHGADHADHGASHDHHAHDHHHGHHHHHRRMRRDYHQSVMQQLTNVFEDKSIAFLRAPLKPGWTFDAQRLADDYNLLDDDKRRDVNIALKSNCASWLPTVTTKEERDQLRMLRRMGENSVFEERRSLLLGRLKAEQRRFAIGLDKLCSTALGDYLTAKNL